MPRHPKCRICGKEHALGGCPEFQSTAARKDVQEQARGHLEPRETQRGQIQGAGTQALPVDTLIDEWTARVIQKHKDRLAYQAQYQRWLRAASKLGISVKQYREGKQND